MAEARKCDRCGALYEEYKVNSPTRTDRYKVNSIITGVKGYRNEPKDLCPECMESFIRWFNFNAPREEMEATDGGK